MSVKFDSYNHGRLSPKASDGSGDVCLCSSFSSVTSSPHCYLLSDEFLGEYKVAVSLGDNNRCL